MPGIQLLHCLQSSPGGGENVFIDGFAAAALVRDEDPQAFTTLTSTPLTFRYEDADTLLRASGPIITVNPAGDVRAIRWNDRSVEPPTVAPDDVAEVYRAMRAFASVLERSDLHLHVTLAPGECIVFDNTRILHAADRVRRRQRGTPPSGLLRRSRRADVDAWRSSGGRGR